MAFITEIVNHIKKNYNLSKESLTIIFPNKRAALKLRTELKNSKLETNVWLPQVLSIQEAMCSWSGMQLLDNIDITFELIKILNNFNRITSNDIFGLASQMLKDFDEIDQYAIDAKNIFQNTEEAKKLDLFFIDENRQIDKQYIEFFSSLNDYYLSLRKTLFESNTGYYGLISRYIYELDQEKLNAAIGNNRIIFAGFNAMTKTEEGIIVKLIQNNKAELIWDLDEYYFKDEKQEAGHFARDFFNRHPNIPLPESNFLGKKLIEEIKNINIIGASGTVIQTNALQLELHKEGKSEVDRSDEVIVLSDETMLIPVLNCIPNNIEKMQVTMGFPYSQTILNQFLQHLFAFQNNIKNKEKGIYFWSLARLLNSELIKTIFTNQELTRLFNWKNEHIKKSTFYISIDDYKTLEEYSDTYIFLCAISKKWNSTSDCIESIKNLLIIIHNKVKANDSTNFISNQISVAGRIINKIDKLLSKYEQIIDISYIEMLYKQSSSETTINLKGDDDGLQIMGLLETRNLDFKTVHILSVNEGILPQSKNANSLIPYDLRVSYGLPTYNNKQAVYAYHFYRLLQNAENINIYHNTLAGGMGEGDSSRFIKQILHEMPSKNPNVNICEKIYKSPNTKHITTELEVEKTDEIYEKIIKKLTFVSESEDKISGLSPTSLSCYLTCPLKFYLQYIESIKDENPNELIQSNKIGSIIHTTLENLYKHFGDQEITSSLYKEIYERHFEDSFKEALTTNNLPNGLPDTGFNYLSSKMIDKMIKNFIVQEINFLDNNKSMRIIGLEQRLHCTLEIPTNNNTINVNLLGFADRIDQVGDKVRILDYKTGKIEDFDVKITNKFAAPDITNFSKLPEKAIQLLVYKYLYKKANDNIDEENIEPGIFGLKKISKGIFSLSNNSKYFKGNDFITEFESIMIDIFSEILNRKVPFKQAEDEKKCKNCNFMEICKRYPKARF